MVLALDLLRCSGNGNQVVGEAFPDWFGSWGVVVYPVSNYDAGIFYGIARLVIAE
jgi:hypothetical protein